MNRQSIMQLLRQLLGDVVLHKKLVEEIIKLIVGSGYESKFFKTFQARLEYLSQHGASSIDHEEFEPISNGIFSMHVAGHGFNIRILYTFSCDRDPMLLLAFYEREGKSKTDYTPYVAPALERFHELSEE